jgi:hypothetical protein
LGLVVPLHLLREGMTNMVEAGTSLEVALLAELRAALTDHMIRSEVRTSVAALAVEASEPDGYLWVFVAFEGRYFSWDNADQQHPVNDIRGAAKRIADQVSGDSQDSR